MTTTTLTGDTPWGRRGERDPRYNSKRWKLTRKQVLIKAGYICKLCGHGPGHGAPAQSVDHLTPVEVSPELFFTYSNLAPMHDIRHPCSVCALASKGTIKGACNQLKGANSIGQAQERLKRRTGLEFGMMRGQPEDIGPDGREW